MSKPANLNVILGRDDKNVPIEIDLAKAPHLLIAGTTGSGKSVLLNSIIVQFLNKKENTKDNLEFVFIDPKIMELRDYGNLNNLLYPELGCITDPTITCNVLSDLVAEMRIRNDLIAESGKKNIDSYNQIVDNPLSKIVVVIDEYADLMQPNSAYQDEYDKPSEIKRAQNLEIGKTLNAVYDLSRLARAAGIHLILCTQRPCAKTIDPRIKANFSTKIALMVENKNQSRIIIDCGFAAELKGNGDMFLRDYRGMTRLQGDYIADEQILETINNFNLKNPIQEVIKQEIKHKKDWSERLLAVKTFVYSAWCVAVILGAVYIIPRISM